MLDFTLFSIDVLSIKEHRHKIILLKKLTNLRQENFTEPYILKRNDFVCKVQPCH